MKRLLIALPLVTWMAAPAWAQVLEPELALVSAPALARASL